MWSTPACCWFSFRMPVQAVLVNPARRKALSFLLTANSQMACLHSEHAFFMGMSAFAATPDAASFFSQIRQQLWDLWFAEPARAAETVDNPGHTAAVQHEGCHCWRLSASIQSKQWKEQMHACQASKQQAWSSGIWAAPVTASVCVTVHEATPWVGALCVAAV